MDAPVFEFRRLYKALREHGRAFVLTSMDGNLPHHQYWSAKDEDFHLYTFSARNLGNLLTRAGFQVCACHQYVTAWAHYDKVNEFQG